MTGFTYQQLKEIGSHLEKISDIQEQNSDSDELTLELPNKIWVNETDSGAPLGNIEWSSGMEEYVFVPFIEEEPTPPKWASTIPMPNF